MSFSANTSWNWIKQTLDKNVFAGSKNVGMNNKLCIKTQLRNSQMQLVGGKSIYQTNNHITSLIKCSIQVQQDKNRNL